ncbi:putative mediator of RNA polymerase II transcription subunit 26 isoform X4 [Drosophila mauritiana]|uniref:Mediator of RNA polymerase II transcription subunit 26 isoform X4 n=1 Tax=Drosophila mauritiana TaxID=7226 RepID=A0A6P8KA39_DROMA|nr:putative mediator of RNA polymerase II transcription subunit 26 isoform X4 [Drosophila mauritiana]
MLLLLLAFIMRFVDISKRCAACSRAGIDCTHHGGQSNSQASDANGNHTACWQHVAGGTSNSSSTSSGCDSNSSSKENYYVPQQQQHQRQRAAKHSKPGNIGVSPQQLEQIRFYQRMQQQQLQLLQQQLLQRRRLQQQLLQQGVPSPPATANATTTTAGLTCNQQYLRQQRMQQQQLQQQQQQQYVDHNSNNDNDYLNNYLNNSINQRNNGRVLGQGTKIRRGMTEFSTNNDHSKPHFTASQQKPHQNSPIHQQAFTPSNPNTHPHLLQRLAQQQQQQQHQRPHKFQQTLPFSQLNNGNNTAAHILPGSSPHSPLSYRNPLNSPSNSPFSNTAQTTIGKRFQQQQLTDRLLQQQHLQQCQQQQLQSLGSSDVEEDLAAEELSEESVKQNVAIVLSNLDRYNNALRSIILNEQVSSSLITPSDSLLFGEDSSGLLYCDNDNSRKHQGNNNFVLGKMAATPESDYNSNATTPGGRSSEQQLQQQQQQQQQLGWFLDYGYRDGCGGMQRSVLSSLSASYNAMGDLIYYEDLAKNLDANLAEVDMESFRAEDIHSLLSHLPAYCKSLGGANSRLQQSLLLQQQQQQQQQLQQQQVLQHSNMLQHNLSQTSTTSTNELIDNSFCKSELLFSPVRESHISVDSLDMDAYPDDGEIILTCNKDNYTIAFEGSVLYSDDSFYADTSDIVARNKQNCINLHSNLEDIVKRNKALEVSMSRSAQAFQPICPMSPKGQAATSSAAKLQRRSLFLVSPARRYPSGNNNTETITITRHLPQCTVRKSSSLPNLQNEESMAGSCHKEQGPEESGPQAVPLNVSQAISTSTMEAGKSRSRNMLPMCQMPISISASISERLQQQADQQLTSEQITPTSQQPQQQHHHSHHHRHKHRCSCSQESQNFHISGSASSGNSSNPPAFNLVKLFIKQKSSNSSGGQEDLGAQASAHTCMDVSSGCWPSSDAASSSSGSLEQRLRKKSMNDSGKGSAVSRHDEEEHYPDTETPRRQLRARSEAVFYDDVASSSSTGSLTATNSPAHRRRSMPLRNPQLYQLAAQVSTGSQMSSEASSEQLTQVPRRAEAGCGTSTRPLSCASSSEMITRSMQTSCGSLSTTRSSVSDRYRCVPPSFLEKLNNLGEERKAPIYVIYPNYALPDLGFVKTNASTDVIFSPFNYKMTMDGATGSTSSSGSLRKQRNSSQSVSEDEILKTLDYKHVADWQSLATLLPSEYRRRLQHIPEVKHLVRQLDAELSQRPLFCMSPPLRRNRTHICDCAKYFQGQQTQMDEASSSGSSQQPSSGYRGSSTLLTDSELDVDPLKQMYVYQYDQQRMDSGVETSPGSQLTQTPPQPMPRSILRKAHSAQSRSKRNSMIEAQQTQKLTKLEKRRSLQEPPNNYGLGSTDELADVFEEEEHSQQAPPVKQRLSRKDLDARARAESFLASLPRSELKYYAEIASILESSGEHVTYDAAALKKEVSRVLSQQKKVSFNDEGVAAGLQQHAKRFATPPNSPNISMGALKRDTVDVLEQRKIESNRFKRLQIQWELMSKDSSMLKELANEAATKSGGSTPTSGNSTGSNSAPRSRIPRPVSYPAGRSSTPTSSRTAPVLATPSPARPATPKTVTKSHNKPGLFTSPRPSRLTSAQEAAGGNKVSTRSPSRIVQPKRYSLAGATTPTSTTPTSARARTPTNRVAVTAPNTPKRQAVAQSPRPTSRVR